MKSGRFYESFKKFGFFLIHNKFDKISGNAKLCYDTKYIPFFDEISSVIERIEYDIDTFDSFTKKLMPIILSKDNEEFINDSRKQEIHEYQDTIFDAFTKLNLDIKSFYIFTKIFLDCLAEIIAICYKERIKKRSMSSFLNDIGKQKKKVIVDNKTFFSRLEQLLDWYDDFNINRHIIVHRYPQLKYTNTKDGKFGYTMLKKLSETWGSETVKPIKDDIIEKISRLSDILEYLTSNLEISHPTGEQDK